MRGFGVTTGVSTERTSDVRSATDGSQLIKISASSGLGVAFPSRGQWTQAKLSKSNGSANGLSADSADILAARPCPPPAPLASSRVPQPSSSVTLPSAKLELPLLPQSHEKYGACQTPRQSRVAFVNMSGVPRRRPPDSTDSRPVWSMSSSSTTLSPNSADACTRRRHRL